MISAKEILSKYLLNKDIDFKGIIVLISKNKYIFNLVLENSLVLLEEHFIEIDEQIQEITPESSNKDDEIISSKHACKNALQFIHDLTKIRRLLEKKNIGSDYVMLIKILADMINDDQQKNRVKLAIPEYKLISKLTTIDTEEMKEIIREYIEEVELQEFEENLEVPNKKIIDCFENLNGHQFEDYLKDLFSALGYQVVRTKNSGDQGADLIIKNGDEKTVVQAKKYSGFVTNKAIQEVVASKAHYGANKAMVVTTGNFTKSALILAKSNNVELWDGKKLKKTITDTTLFQQ